ncbi:hypothetical protein MARA_47870 [Mycolicibacterium arabiense]|uniref:Uncharacterized protein n=1 Tax=Mycolicibacterium arabiense TaxID=1286181 RepID=A0A7I7S4X5_9MYCO|nr:hypothetical protein MARA_47870 [Mycolicibacterium arabiense]
MATANAASSLAGTYTADSPADTRASTRSNDTSGADIAMYSTTLFIVDTSFSGFFGSGDRQTSAVDRQRWTNSSGTRPVNSTISEIPSSAASSTMSSSMSPPPMNTK